MQIEIRSADFLPLIDELGKISRGPGEAAELCLALFFRLWQMHDPLRSLEEIAEAARTMILSYECDTLQ